MKALKKRILAKRAAAAAKGESPEDGPEDLRDDAETAGDGDRPPPVARPYPGKR